MEVTREGTKVPSQAPSLLKILLKAGNLRGPPQAVPPKDFQHKFSALRFPLSFRVTKREWLKLKTNTGLETHLNRKKGQELN